MQWMVMEISNMDCPKAGYPNSTTPWFINMYLIPKKWGFHHFQRKTYSNQRSQTCQKTLGTSMENRRIPMSQANDTLSTSAVTSSCTYSQCPFSTWNWFAGKVHVLIQSMLSFRSWSCLAFFSRQNVWRRATAWPLFMFGKFNPFCVAIWEAICATRSCFCWTIFGILLSFVQFVQLMSPQLFLYPFAKAAPIVTTIFKLSSPNPITLPQVLQGALHISGTNWTNWTNKCRRNHT